MRSLKLTTRGIGSILPMCGLLSALPLCAQSTNTDNQHLGSALNEFATQANIEILFAQELVNNQTTTSLDYSADTPRLNLKKLLTGTGLTFKEPSQNVFIITQAKSTRTEVDDGNAATAKVRWPLNDPSLANEEGGLEGQEFSNEFEPNTDMKAAPGVISGQVLDKISGQPLAGAIVQLDDSDRTVSTDTRGFYRFATAPVGEYKISVSYLGSLPQSRQVVVKSKETTTQDFVLENETEVVVIYGNRSSLQQALNQQRAAANSAAVVSSDLMGSFPAETISEALRRVSGVSFSRDDTTGEGDRITVRGFNSQAINIQLNGIDLQGTGVDRSVDLSGFLTDNIKQVTIQKSLLPSQEATGSGGLVEIETRSGLDYGERYFNLSTEFERPFESGFGDEFEVSATGALMLTDDLGMALTVQHRKTQSQNYDVSIIQNFNQVLPLGFTSISSVPESYDFPFDSEFNSTLVHGAGYYSRQRDESNLTVSINLAYDWDDHTRLRIDLQSIGNDTSYSTATTLAGFLTSSTDMPVPELNDEVRRRYYIRAFRPSLAITDNDEDLTTRSISFRGETNLSQWEFDYTLGYSDIEKERLQNTVSFLSDQNTAVNDIISANTVILNTDDDDAMTERAVDGAVMFANNGVPLLSLSDLGQSLLSDPETYYGNVASLSEAVDTTKNYVFELSGRKYFNNSSMEYLEVGGKYNDLTRSNSDDALSTTAISRLEQYVRITGTNTSITELDASGLGSMNLADIGLPETNIPTITPGSASALVTAFSNFVEDDPNTSENEARFNLTDYKDVSAIDISGAASPAKVTEKIFAGYIESKFNFNKLELVGGVRYQREERTGTAISTPIIRLDELGFTYEPRATFIEAGLIDYINTSGVQTSWTPSVIANYRPTDNTVVRGAYFRSTVHPSIDKIVRPQTVQLDLREGFASATIREANPDLEPSITNNYDLDFSYYFEDNPGLVRLGLFYKKVSNNFTNTLVADEEATSDIRERALAALAPLNDINPALLDLPDDADYFLQRPRNGEGGDIYGFEAEVIRQLDFMPKSWPSFIQNFSVLGNITYTKSDFEDLEVARNDDGEQFTLVLERPLLRQSEWTGNASIRYEDGPFSGNVIYTYQSSSASSYDEFNLNGIIPEYDTLDLRLSYTFNTKGNGPRIVVFMEGDDLLRSADEADVRAGTGSEFGDGNVDFFFPSTLQFNGGRRVTLGASVRF